MLKSNMEGFFCDTEKLHIVTLVNNIKLATIMLQRLLTWMLQGSWND